MYWDKPSVRFGGLSWLAQQAIRMRRTKWTGAELLGEELWTILSRLRDAEVAPAEPTEPGTTPAPQFPPIDIPPINPFDIETPDIPDINIEQPDDETFIVEQKQRQVSRTMVPGVIVGAQDSHNYDVQIYPNGRSVQDQTSGEWFISGNPDEFTSEVVTAYQWDMADDEYLPEGIHVMVCIIKILEVTTLSVYQAGQAPQTNTSVKLLSEDNSICSPVWV